MPIRQIVEGPTGVKAKVWASAIEQNTFDQIRKTTQLRGLFSHVASMADSHLGIGCTIGSVIATKDTVCPAGIGVDIGCGMLAYRTNLTASDIPSDCMPILHQIKRDVPTGAEGHVDFDRVLCEITPDLATAVKKHLREDFDSLRVAEAVTSRKKPDAVKQMGTPGGGKVTCLPAW